MLSANVVRKTVNQATARWGVRAYAIILNGKEYVVGYFFFNFKTQKISQRGSAATCAGRRRMRLDNQCRVLW